jgi:AraC-like DNA-binding protein
LHRAHTEQVVPGFILGFNFNGMNPRYQEFAPSPRFAAHIECFWRNSSVEPIPSFRILPDGCADILFEQPGGRRGRGLIAVGTMTRAQSFDLPARQFTFGVRFRPGMAARFLRVAGTEIVNGLIALDDAWGAARARRLFEQLAESASPRETIARFEASLGEPPALDPAERAIAWLAENRGQVPVEELADAASLSARQFRRICLERTGITPKRLARVLRFRQAAAQASPARRAGWAQVALDCGYYDQAHLINEFREFSGLAPGEFAASPVLTDFPAPLISLGS